MTQAAALKSVDVPYSLFKADRMAVAFIVTDRLSIAVKDGTIVHFEGRSHSFEADTPVDLPDLVEGLDYDIWITPDGAAVAFANGTAPDASGSINIGGFHFAPGGNADGVAGGDDTPAINPFSCWDLTFRPACADPRGMALIDGRFWCDIYLTSSTPDLGTSQFGAVIADGKSMPPGVTRFDFASATAVLAAAGKQLLGAEEFFAAAYGVTERSANGMDPKEAGLDAPRTSRWGIMQATGNMWVWGTDGHPDAPRASFFGGSWLDGSNAGSRYAVLGCGWPGSSFGALGARGRSDHLNLA